ncbi:MAG: endolytic transglycosylase MltG [Syntrophomonas sp.]|nr:endolytic transglycosylase MltG [Syntrophomonas sp.]
MIETEMRKTNPKIILLLAAFLVILLFSGWQTLSNQLQPMDPADSSIIEVRLPEGSSARRVAALLKQNGLIRNEIVFLSYCRQKGMDKQLQAGLYEFNRSQSLPELALQISRGDLKSMAITIPEGYTVRQIGELLIKEQLCTPQQWEEAIRANYDYDFLTNDVVESDKRLEGFLFPDTYTIDESSSPQNIVKIMLANFSAVWDKEYAAQAAARQMSVRNTIIVASLIEREAQVPEERKTIAGVIYNRLEKGMPLQIDATVLYSLGEHRETVTYKDLEIDSPYNTYKKVGLPPGPIASPGKAAIEAALNPEAHDYYYYVARGDGSHQFSTTYAEHLAAKRSFGL